MSWIAALLITVVAPLIAIGVGLYRRSVLHGLRAGAIAVAVFAAPIYIPVAIVALIVVVGAWTGLRSA